jgi:hypothetical protein
MTSVRRFVVGVIPLGTDAPLASLTRAVAQLGQVPVDLVGAGVLGFEPWETVVRFLELCDYLTIAVGVADDLRDEDVGPTERAFDLAVERNIPVLTLFHRDWTSPGERNSTNSTLLSKLNENPFGMSARYDTVDAELAGAVGRLLSTFTRPGYISAAQLPSENVAEQLALLMRENHDLKRKLNEDLGEAASRRRETVVRLLQGNRIVIPLWYRGATGWGQPVEMTLYDFFLRMGPELAAEVSTEAAAEFIPVGVCGLEREDFRPRWPVPSNNLNLWFTDLMAIGVVEPSLRIRRAKDSGQYWTLTEEGRQLLSDIRRSVLSDGGHRHVGFTSEFRIVQDVDADV